MKLNKQILKQIIKEELENFSEAEGYTRSDTRRDAVGTAKQQLASGITDEERGLIRDLVAQLSAGAGKTNILSGVLGTKIQQLIAVLKKVTGDQGGSDVPKRPITVDDLKNAANTAKGRPGGNK